MKMAAFSPGPHLLFKYHFECQKSILVGTSSPRTAVEGMKLGASPYFVDESSSQGRLMALVVLLSHSEEGKCSFPHQSLMLRWIELIIFQGKTCWPWNNRRLAPPIQGKSEEVSEKRFCEALNLTTE